MLYDYADPSLFEIIEGYSPVILLKSKPGKYDEAYQSLKKIPHANCWESSRMPKKFHYGTNPRTLEFVVLADSAWTIVQNPVYKVPKGAHGFDPDNPNMHAIFYASGPSFKKGYNAGGVNNIDLYPLITRLLSLRPANVDGTIDNVAGMLK